MWGTCSLEARTFPGWSRPGGRSCAIMQSADSFLRGHRVGASMTDDSPRSHTRWPLRVAGVLTTFRDLSFRLKSVPAMTGCRQSRLFRCVGPQSLGGDTHFLDKAEVPVLTVKGDTLVYNAVAVRTFEGDELIKIVEQLPGVLTSENGVSVMGKDISRTCVDGKLIFGSDPMAALQNLLANDVLSLGLRRVCGRNPRCKRRKGDEMRRVFNVETKSKLIQVTTGHFLASYGADLNEGGRGGTTTATGSVLRSTSSRRVCYCRPMPFSIISTGNRIR